MAPRTSQEKAREAVKCFQAFKAEGVENFKQAMLHFVGPEPKFSVWELLVEAEREFSESKGTSVASVMKELERLKEQKCDAT